MFCKRKWRVYLHYTDDSFGSDMNPRILNDGPPYFVKESAICTSVGIQEISKLPSLCEVSCPKFGLRNVPNHRDRNCLFCRRFWCYHYCLLIAVSLIWIFYKKILASARSTMAKFSAAWVFLMTFLICLDYQAMGIYLSLFLTTKCI